MKRRIGKAAVALPMLILLLLTTTISANALNIGINQDDANIIVDQSGNGDYRSIQQAINNAQPGSIIYVKSGEYREIIDIKKQITLIGEGKDSTLISPISEKNKYAVRLGAPGAKIQNFGIKNGAPGLYTSAVRFTSSNVEIYDCDIYETPVGIVIWTSDNIIEGCRFWSCVDEGIALIGTTYSDCDNNIIRDCIFRENCDGIELQYSSSNTISNCEFYDNTHSGIDAISSSNDYNVISNCEIYDNEVHGIYFSSSSENQIIDCDIYNNDDGNIIERGDSENNQVITNEQADTNDKKDTMFYTIGSALNSYIERLISMLTFIRSY